MPPSLQAALTLPVRLGGLEVVEHVLVLVVETGSFDRRYGTLRGVRGLDERYPLELPPWAGHEVLPAEADLEQALLFELADTFTICDGYYSCPPGTAAVNREALLSGRLPGAPITSEPYPHLLSSAGISWRVYQERDSSEPGTAAGVLRADIRAGRLPAVSWLLAPDGTGAPAASTAISTAARVRLVYDVLDAIACDEHIWASTAVLLTTDGPGGFPDHVPPPAGFGPRIPMTVISPWTVGGFVDSTIYDHTSVLRLLERWTGIEAPGIPARHRRVAGELTGAFDFAHADRPQWLPRPRFEHAAAPDSRAQPGTRPARPLPYQPSVSAAVNRSGRLILTLRNTGRSAVPFTIYPYAGEAAEPICRDVVGTHTERLSTPSGDYRITVQGPNRAWWEIHGSAGGKAAGLDLRTVLVSGRLGIDIVLSNPHRHPLALELRAVRYGRTTKVVTVPARGSTSVRWPTERGWYDVEVTTEADTSFLRRLTGRVEDGKPGVSG